MTPENSRVSGDTEAKLRFVRDTLNQFHTVEDVAMFSMAMLNPSYPPTGSHSQSSRATS